MTERHPRHPFLREVSDQLYTNNMPTVVVGIVVSILLVLMLWRQAASGALLAGWMASVLAVYIGRFLLAQAYFRAPTRGSRAWLTRFRVGAALQGALWGLSAFILFPGQRPVDDIAYLFAISGLTAGAAIAFGIDITSMLWFELPLAAPLMARMFMLQSADYVVMGLLVLLFLAYVSIVLPRSSAAIRENLRLRLQAAQREAESRERNALLDGILDNEPECVKIIALNGTLQMMNKAGLAMIEVGSVEEANAAGLLNFIHPDHRKAFRRLMDTVFQGLSGQLEFQVVGKRGALRWLDTNATPLRNAAGEITGLLGVTRNVTARKRTEHDLQKSEQRYRMLSSGTFEGILLTSQGRIVDLNEQLARMLGYARGEMLGRLLADFIAPEHRELVARNIASGEEHSGEVGMLHQSGRRVLVEGHGQSYEQDGVLMRLTAIRDITERKASEEETQRLAFNDPLTGLPNRRLFMDRLQQSIAVHARAPRVGALLFIDLDNFKNVNDSLGHDYGDMLLRQIAQRLTACVRQGDTVARLGGDEFVVLLEDLSADIASAVPLAEGVARKVLETLNRPYDLAGTRYGNTPSIGVTLIGGRDASAQALLKQADVAMYQAKKSGRNTVRFFDVDLQEAIVRRTALAADLPGALERGEIFLHFQVQVSAQRKPVGGEALLRWNHPARGMIPPAEFIPLAVQSGQMPALEQALLDQACARLKAWEADPHARGLSLAVNVSAQQFRQPDFAEQVAENLRRHGVNPGRLRLEMTEAMVLHDLDEALRTLNALNEIGVQLALDDFGTGYSSLQYLKRLPLDQIKINRSFVRELGENSGALAFVQTIIAMADSMGLDVIAKGVETAQQFDILHKSGCTHFQGFLFGTPMPAAEFEAALTAHAVTAQ